MPYGGRTTARSGLPAVRPRPHQPTSARQSVLTPETEFSGSPPSRAPGYDESCDYLRLHLPSPKRGLSEQGSGSILVHLRSLRHEGATSQFNHDCTLERSKLEMNCCALSCAMPYSTAAAANSAGMHRERLAVIRPVDRPNASSETSDNFPIGRVIAAPPAWIFLTSQVS